MLEYPIKCRETVTDIKGLANPDEAQFHEPKESGSLMRYFPRYCLSRLHTGVKVPKRH
jgi:hypothetical protein